MTKEFLNIDDLAKFLGLKKSTLYSMVGNGDLPHYRIGRLIRFKRNDVDAWMESHRREKIDFDKRAKEILKNTTRPTKDIDALVKKSIEEVKNRRYNCANGKPDQSRAGKEVQDGSI